MRVVTCALASVDEKVASETTANPPAMRGFVIFFIPES
jgi:hypothetical protein